MSGWDHFQHMADMGVHGFGESLAEAFEQAALAMIAVIADPTRVHQDDVVEVVCTAPDRGLLLVDWLNAWVYEIATRNPQHAVLPLPGHAGRWQSARPRLGRTAGPRAPSAGTGGQGRNLDRTACLAG